MPPKWTALRARLALALLATAFLAACAGLTLQSEIDGLMKEFLKYDRKELQAYVGLAKAYWESGDKGKALETFKEVLQRDPRHEEALRYLMRR